MFECTTSQIRLLPRRRRRTTLTPTQAWPSPSRLRSSVAMLVTERRARGVCLAPADLAGAGHRHELDAVGFRIADGEGEPARALVDGEQRQGRCRPEECGEGKAKGNASGQ